MSPAWKEQGRSVPVLAVAGVVGVVLSALAVELLGDVAVGALLGVLIVLVALGLVQQVRYARRSAADLAAVSRAVTKVAQDVSALSDGFRTQSKTVSAVSSDVKELSTTVTAWSKDVKVAEIETGIAALNRYVALGSDDTTHKA